MESLVARVLRTSPIPVGTKVRLAERIGDRSASGQSRLVVTRMHDGFRMKLDLALAVERTMYYTALYDPWFCHTFKRVLQPGDVMVDAGANIGFFSLLAAKYVGPMGAVHAFEPIPTTFARFSENLSLNKYANITANITANCIALAAQAGELEFEMSLETGTDLILNRLASVVHTGHGPQVTVQADTLDAYVAKKGIGHIKLAKFDIEGGEVSAVAGMREILHARQISYLLSEVNVPLLEQQGLKPSAIRDAFAAHGYHAYYFKRARGRRRPLQVQFIPVAQMTPPDIFGDYLFVAPGLQPPPMH